MFLLDSHLYSIQNTNAIPPSSSSKGVLFAPRLWNITSISSKKLYFFSFFYMFWRNLFSTKKKKFPFVKILSICFPLIRFAQCADLMLFFFWNFLFFFLGYDWDPIWIIADVAADAVCVCIGFNWISRIEIDWCCLLNQFIYIFFLKFSLVS